VVVEDDFHGFLEVGSAAHDPVAAAAPERIRERFLGVIHEGELASFASRRLYRFGGGERADLDSTPVEDRDDAAVQPRIELELDAVAPNGDRSRREREEDGPEQSG